MADSNEEIKKKIKKAEDESIEKIKEKILSDKKAELKNIAEETVNSDEEIEEPSDLEEPNNENATSPRKNNIKPHGKGSKKPKDKTRKGEG